VAEDLVGGIFKDEVGRHRESLIAWVPTNQGQSPRGALDPPKDACVGEASTSRGQSAAAVSRGKDRAGAAQDKVEATFLFDLYGTWCSEPGDSPDTQLGKEHIL